MYIPNTEKATVSGLFAELKERVEREGVSSHEAYMSLVDEILEEKRSIGQLGDDDDFTLLKADLGFLWNELNDSLQEE